MLGLRSAICSFSSLLLTDKLAEGLDLLPKEQELPTESDYCYLDKFAESLSNIEHEIHADQSHTDLPAGGYCASIAIVNAFLAAYKTAYGHSLTRIHHGIQQDVLSQTNLNHMLHKFNYIYKRFDYSALIKAVSQLDGPDGIEMYVSRSFKPSSHRISDILNEGALGDEKEPFKMKLMCVSIKAHNETTHFGNHAILMASHRDSLDLSKPPRFLFSDSRGHPHLAESSIQSRRGSLLRMLFDQDFPVISQAIDFTRLEKPASRYQFYGDLYRVIEVTIRPKAQPLDFTKALIPV